jgi:hypothetical protein
VNDVKNFCEDTDTPAGSHHGEPELTRHDFRLLECFRLWISTVRKSPGYDEDWMPSDADIIKSRLFWRIRSGKDPLPHPPPRAYSCPWYEVIEMPDKMHSSAFELVERERDGGTFVYINQCSYQVIEKGDDGKYLLGFGPYRFYAWNGQVEWRNVGGGVSYSPGAIIHRCPERESR